MSQIEDELKLLIRSRHPDRSDGFAGADFIEESLGLARFGVARCVDKMFVTPDNFRALRS